MAYEIQQLLQMTQSQLDELFTASPAGDIPDGEGKGTAIIGAGSSLTLAVQLQRQQQRRSPLARPIRRRPNSSAGPTGQTPSPEKVAR